MTFFADAVTEAAPRRSEDRDSGPRARYCKRPLQFFSVACSVISGTLANAFESGQSRLAAAAISWNFASSMPGTLASIVSAMRSMTKPSNCSA